jgi:hypothetical protein
MLAATVGLVVFLQGSRGAGPSTEQLASLVGPVAPMQVPWGKRMRGGPRPEEQPELPPEHEDFQLGVRFLYLRLALAGGNRDDADDALRRLHLLLERMPFPPLEARANYDELRKRLGPQVPPPTLLAAAAAAEKKAMKELGEDPRLVELGRWTEACRLAGENGRAGLFRGPATLRVLDRAMSPGGKDADNLDPKALAIVRAIREDVASDRIDPVALGGRCRALLEQLANDDQ